MRRLLPRALVLLVVPALLVPLPAHGAGSVTLAAGPLVSATNNDKLFQPPSPPNPPGYVPDPAARLGYALTIGYEREVLTWLAWSAGLGLETRGENATLNHPNPSVPVVEIALKLSYLQAPVHVIVRREFGPVTLGLFGGATVGRVVQAERTRKVDGVAQPVVKAEINKTDLGIEAGATAEMKAGPGALFVRPGYHWGLLDFSREHSAKHRAGRILAGYAYRL